MILVAVTKIFWVSMMNKLYYGCQFWYVTILFSSNKLLKLKYIHHYFFLKFLTKKSRYVLWAGASYGPGNMVLGRYDNPCTKGKLEITGHRVLAVSSQEIQTVFNNTFTRYEAHLRVEGCPNNCAPSPQYCIKHPPSMSFPHNNTKHFTPKLDKR